MNKFNFLFYSKKHALEILKLKKFSYKNIVDNLSNNEKFFKLTFSGLDKFLTNEKLKELVSQINEIKLLRINKSTNKNYCHADISSNLSVESLKKKMESIKILGKSVKVRVKEIDEEDGDTIFQKNENFDFSKLSEESNSVSNINLLKNFVKNFYLKNLTDNPMNIKYMLDYLEKSNNFIQIINYKRQFFDFEYKIKIPDNFVQHKKLKLSEIFLPIKTLEQYDEINENSAMTIEILNKFDFIFSKLNYTHYDNLKNKGVLRNINIKICNNHYIVTLMISSSSISNLDIKIITEAIKYEFERFSLQNLISVYLSINEKVNAMVYNSSEFHHIVGTGYIPYPTTLNPIIKIYPFVKDCYLCLEKINLNEIFNLDKFDLIFDNSSTNIPFSCLGKNSYDTMLFLEPEKRWQNMVEKNGQINNQVELINKEMIKNIEVQNKLNKEISSEVNNLIILNLTYQNYNKNIVRNFKYIVVFSNSFSQMLDFIKTIKNNDNKLKFKKITFVKDLQFDVKEIILALEI